MFDCTGRDNCAKVAARERRGLKFDEAVEDSNYTINARLKLLEERLSAGSSEHQERLTALEAASLTKDEWVDLLQRVVALENSRTDPIASDTLSPPDTAKTEKLELRVAALEKAGVDQQALVAASKTEAKAQLASSSSQLDVESVEASDSPFNALEGRVANIEAFVAEERLKAKEAERAAVEAAFYQLDVKDTPEDLPKKTISNPSELRNVKHLHHELLDSTMRPLGTSTWECLLFVGVPCVGMSSSGMLIVSVLVNIILQGIFVLIAIGPGEFIKDFLPNDAVDSAIAWRLTDGHSMQNMDQATWTSLVDRVCSDDDTLITSSEQSNILKAINTYLTGVPGSDSSVKAGPLLFGVVLVVWTLSITREVCSVHDYVVSILMLPRAPHSNISRSADGRYVLVSSTYPRVIGSLMLSALRLVVALMVFYIGAMWLSNTSSLTELVLNAAALYFVLDLDELVFDNLTPYTVKKLLEELEALEVPSTTWHGFDTRPPAILAITIVCLVVFLHGEVKSMTDRMKYFRYELCERGSTHFVVSRHSTYGFAVASWTNPPSGNKRDLSKSYVAEATAQFMNIEALKRGTEISAEVESGGINIFLENDNPWPGMWTWNKAYFNSIALTSAEKIIGAAPSCDDLLNPISADGSVDNRQMLTEGLTLSVAFGYRDQYATTCEELAQNNACLQETSTDLRLLCSQTCGCSYPRAGLLQSVDGCLGSCLQERFDNFMWYDCEDLPLERLLQHEVIFDSLQFLSTYEPMVAILTDLFRTHGCVILTSKNRSLLTSAGLPKEEAIKIPDRLCGRNFFLETALDPTKVKYNSLRPWCPQSCDCVEQFSIECPHSCSTQPLYDEDEEDNLNLGSPVNLNHPACDGGLCRASRIKPEVLYKNVTVGNDIRSCWGLDAWLRKREGEECWLQRGPDFRVAQDLCCQDF